MTISSNTPPEALEPHQQRAKTLILAARQGLQAAGMTFVAMHFDGVGDEGLNDEPNVPSFWIADYTEKFAWVERAAELFEASGRNTKHAKILPFARRGAIPHLYLSNLCSTDHTYR